MKTKKLMQNLLKYSFYFVFALLLSCTKEEIPSDPTNSSIEKLTINTDIDYGYWGTTGASGYFNDSLLSFGYSVINQYSINENEMLYGIPVRRSIWYENVLWAYREAISLSNLPLDSLNAGDTIHFPIFITFLNVDPMLSLDQIYLDGDAAAECYSVFDGEYDNRLIITEKDLSSNVIAGNVNAKISLNDLCPPKYDPTKPDEYIIRDFNFRAKLR